MNLVEVLALLTFILSLLSLIVEVMDKIYRKKDNENKKD